MPSPQLVDEAAELSGAMRTASSPGLKHEGHQKSPSILTGMICKSLRRVELSMENIQPCCLFIFHQHSQSFILRGSTLPLLIS